MPNTMTVVECSVCHQPYEEFSELVDLIEACPTRELHCIGCNPKADKPALTRVTNIGWRTIVKFRSGNK